MTTEQAWIIISGIALPFLVSIIKGAAWDSRVKFLLALVLCGVAGLVASYIGGQLVLRWDAALIDAAIVFTAAQTIYKLWWGETELGKGRGATEEGYG